MTKVQYCKRGSDCCLSAVGHATGSVEACAAVSAVMCGLSNYLRVHPIHVREKIADRITIADAMVHAKGDASMQAAFDMAAVTLAGVAKGYHDFVEFEEI